MTRKFQASSPSRSHCMCLMLCGKYWQLWSYTLDCIALCCIAGLYLESTVTHHSNRLSMCADNLSVNWVSIGLRSCSSVKNSMWWHGIRHDVYMCCLSAAILDVACAAAIWPARLYMLHKAALQTYLLQRLFLQTCNGCERQMSTVTYPVPSWHSMALHLECA